MDHIDESEICDEQVNDIKHMTREELIEARERARNNPMFGKDVIISIPDDNNNNV